jgi:hypothetical protein
VPWPSAPAHGRKESVILPLKKCRRGKREGKWTQLQEDRIESTSDMHIALLLLMVHDPYIYSDTWNDEAVDYFVGE